MASVVGASPNHVNNYFDVPNYPSYAAHLIAYAKRHAAEERAGMTPIEQMHDAGEIEGFHLQAVNRLMADIKRAATRFPQDALGTNTFEDVTRMRDPRDGELWHVPPLEYIEPTGTYLEIDPKCLRCRSSSTAGAITSAP